MISKDLLMLLNNEERKVFAVQFVLYDDKDFKELMYSIYLSPAGYRKIVVKCADNIVNILGLNKNDQ